MTSEQEITKAIGKRLKALRLLNGTTQQETARIMGLSTQQIQKYEQGTNRISASRLYLLASELDIPVIDFYDELDSEPPQGQGYLQDFMVIATVKALDSIESKPLRNHLYRLIAILAEQTRTKDKKQSEDPEV